MPPISAPDRGTRHEQDHSQNSTRQRDAKVGSLFPLSDLVRIAEKLGAKRLRQPRFHANFGRIFERPQFRPRFHA